MRLTTLMSLSTLLVGCSSTPTIQPVRYETVRIQDIPMELLRCEKAPNPNILKKVRFLKGKEEAKLYTKRLVLTNYKNCQKLKAIKKLVVEK